MIKISKSECKKLREIGVNMGESGISHTVSRKRRTYYLCESDTNLLKLKQIREQYKSN